MATSAQRYCIYRTAVEQVLASLLKSTAVCNVIAPQGGIRLIIPIPFLNNINHDFHEFSILKTSDRFIFVCFCPALLSLQRLSQPIRCSPGYAVTWWRANFSLFSRHISSHRTVLSDLVLLTPSVCPPLSSHLT